MLFAGLDLSIRIGLYAVLTESILGYILYSPTLSLAEIACF